ncbi:MAG: protein phosphatase 2C domain-containing protein, partial [Anaerolineae bacterium]
MSANIRGGRAVRPYYLPCQDAGNFDVGQTGIAAAVVADGVSNNWRSEIASSCAVSEFLDRIAAAPERPDADFYSGLFTDLTNAIRKQAESETGRRPDQWPATTLLVAVFDQRATGGLTLAYVGDGAIWLVRGDRQDGIPLLLPTANRIGLE